MVVRKIYVVLTYSLPKIYMGYVRGQNKMATVLLLSMEITLPSCMGGSGFMKNICTVLRFLTVVGGILAAVVTASGATVTYTYTGETQGGIILDLHTGSFTGNVQVGEYIMTTSTPGFPSTLNTYCTDVGSDLTSPYAYTPTSLSSATGVNPTWISGGIQNAAKLWANDKGTATTAIQTAGLQLAIWEALNNSLTGTFSTSTFANTGNGGFYVLSSDVNTLAVENYAAGLLNNFSSLPVVQDVVWLQPTPEINGSGNPVQGLLLETPPSVPEATSTFGLLGLATAIVGLMGRRFRQTA